MTPPIVVSATGLSWTTRASLPTARYGLGVATGNDGTVYAVGGAWGAASGVDTSLATVEAYTPTSDTWSTKPSMPGGTRSQLGVAACGGKIYALGGWHWNGTEYVLVGTVEAYDPSSNAWATKAPMPTPRVYLGVAASGGKIYAIGGLGTPTGTYYPTLTTVEAYDPVTNTWTARAPMPTARYLLAVATGSDGKIYAIGGKVGIEAINTVEAYDPKTDTWAQKASLPTARFGLGAATSGGSVYAIGGLTATDLALGTVEAYDPKADTWTPQSSLNTARKYVGVAAGNDGTLYAVGGDDATPTVLSTVEAARRHGPPGPHHGGQA